MRITLVIGGPGQGGDPYWMALVLAQREKRPFGCMMATKRAASEERCARECEARSIRCDLPDRHWKTVIFGRAQDMKIRHFTGALSACKDTDPEIIITVHDSQALARTPWLIELQKSEHVRTMQL